MTNFVTDTFTDAAGVNLTAHVGELGASWTKHAGYAADMLITDANRLRCNSATAALYIASGLPASADYSVSADLIVKSLLSSGVGIVIRMSVAADTYYYLQYSVAAAQWQLIKRVAGVTTTLATFGQVLVVGNTYAVKVSVSGSDFAVTVDGASVITATDAAIAAAGSAGVRATTAAANTTGLHLDNFAAADPDAAVSMQSGSGWLAVLRQRRQNQRRAVLGRLLYWRLKRG